MTDRELLEAAARAAGIKALRDTHGVLHDCTGMLPEENIFAAPLWNPLTDDGDALRLGAAVVMQLQIRREVGGSRGEVAVTAHGQHVVEAYSGDPNAAIRRAIVRAAAAMAAQKEPTP